ncbi:hypothetical protein EUTSA_v10012992mg [Eutrema salsugineum]|uniref:Pentacotripeptide-repeat region of PRORP domain-containing protein n=1 Tax=Eutrema salsugineum TaxID=72664 RepID=V4LP53_EUTSA|nr:hypothetical protein EUTSA_v10012992mg [Eutrema salsugineum]
MRYQQWRLMLLRSYRRSHLAYRSPCSQFQVTSIATRSFSCFLHLPSGIGALQQSEELRCLKTRMRSSAEMLKSVGRSFSLSGEDELRKELELSNIVINQDSALKILRKLESNPDVARRFFQWITEAFPGSNVRDKVGEKFQKDGPASDLVRLKKLFPFDCLDNSSESVCDRVCKIVKEEEWGDDVEKRLRDLNVEEFQSDLVKLIVESLGVEPRKALLFFRWIDESGLFKHDEKTYNAIARVLGIENFLDRFQNIVIEMKSAGYEVEIETYVRVSTRFCQSKLIKEAVDLFETAMAYSSSNKPTPHCFCLLLKKIVTAKNLDMDLFSRAVEAYTINGKVLTEAMLKSVLKSSISVDRVAQSNEVLKAMEKGGYLPSSDLQSMIASVLSRKGKKDEADELVDFVEASGNNLDDKAMASLVEGYCDSGKIEEALGSFDKMVGKAGGSYADYAFEKLALAYCNKNQARDACKLLSAQVKQNQLKPRHSTYKLLVRNLLTKKIARDGGFEEALSLLPLMKDHGFPPYLDPFMNYFSKTGTSTEALGFLKAMTSKNFPSTKLVLRVFETMMKSARHSEAQDLLSTCPSYIRNHSDVLELFNSMKPNESAVEKPLAGSA